VGKSSGLAEKSKHRLRKHQEKHESEREKARDDAVVEISIDDVLNLRPEGVGQVELTPHSKAKGGVLRSGSWAMPLFGATTYHIIGDHATICNYVRVVIHARKFLCIEKYRCRAGRGRTRWLKMQRIGHSHQPTRVSFQTWSEGSSSSSSWEVQSSSATTSRTRLTNSKLGSLVYLTLADAIKGFSDVDAGAQQMP